MCLHQYIDFGQRERVIKARLFKYYPLREYHCMAFKRNQLFLAFPSKLNDCFDTSELLIDSFPRFKQTFGWTFESAQQLNRHGICSFIEAADVKNGEMWTHYTNNYNGFAIEYDSKMFDKTSDYMPLHFMPVTYLDKALDLDDEKQSFSINKNEIISIREIYEGGESNSRNLDRLFQCIHLEKNRRIWEKENEWRIILGEIRPMCLSRMLIEHENGYFLKIKEDAYKSLFIGYKVPEQCQTALVDIAKRKGMKTYLVKPVLNNCQWDMEIKDL